MPNAFERMSCERLAEKLPFEVASWLPSKAALSLAPESISTAIIWTGAISSFDPLSPRHEHPQRIGEAKPPQALVDWMADQIDTDLFIASLTIAELQRGILQAPDGKKRTVLETWFAGPSGPRAIFSGRILSFDETAALIWAQLMADGRKLGRPRSSTDMIIAATAVAHDCIIVTANENDFAGLDIINPMRADP